MANLFTFKNRVKTTLLIMSKKKINTKIKKKIGFVEFILNPCICIHLLTKAEFHWYESKIIRALK